MQSSMLGRCTIGAERRSGAGRGAPSLLGGVIAAALCCALPLAAHAAPSSPAHQLLRGGRYAAAEKAFARVAGPQGLLGSARVQLETGRYAQAAKTARRAAKGKWRAAALTLAAEAQRQLGQRRQAVRTLKDALAREPKHYRALLYLGLLHHELGEAALAKAIFDTFYDDYGGGTIDKSSAEQLTYVALACRLTDNFRDASDTLGDAVKADPRHVEAWVQWGEMSLEKYEAGYAEKHYGEALKINPHHVDALVGLARVKLEQSNDVPGALALLDQARATNPASIDAEVVRAQTFIDNEEHVTAEAILDKALQADPQHLGALSMLAASYFLRDDHAAFAKVKARVLGINGRYTELFRTVVKLAVRHHRYTESIKLGEEAIKIDPQDWYSLADLGTNYLRLGQDDKGLAYLKQAWQGDQYNVRNFNLLNLYDDVIAKSYEFIRTKHFRLRVHKTEKELVRRIVGPVLERAYGHYAKKYGFQPTLPITVELFRDPNHYAVRTVGLPGLAALGVCFGPVITTTSPTLGRFNWAQVLWHELNHVFSIQLSRSRVPRWFTEGLADLEPTLINKVWKRENDFDIYRAIRSGRLHGLASMNAAFTRARNLQDMVVAYYQGSLMVGYLIEHWGLNKVLSALREYGKGQRTEQILPALTGVTLEQLDQRFRKAQLQRLDFFKHNWHVALGDYDDLKVRRQAVQAKPADAQLVAEYAAALIVAGKQRAAAIQLEDALRKQPNNRLALYLSATVALQQKNVGAAEKQLLALIAAGGDGQQAQLALGQLALQRKNLKAAERHLRRAKQLNPDDGLAYHLLARAFEQAGRTDQLIDELKQIAELEQQSFAPVAKLVGLLAKRKDWAGVRHYGELAYNINPVAVTLHRHLAEAYLAAAPKPRPDRAIWQLETALMAQPGKKSVVADLHARLARIYLLRKDKRRARAHLRKARQADPDLPELPELQRQL